MTDEPIEYDDHPAPQANPNEPILRVATNKSKGARPGDGHNTEVSNPGEQAYADNRKGAKPGDGNNTEQENPKEGPQDPKG